MFQCLELGRISPWHVCSHRLEASRSWVPSRGVCSAHRTKFSGFRGNAAQRLKEEEEVVWLSIKMAI